MAGTAELACLAAIILASPLPLHGYSGWDLVLIYQGLEQSMQVMSLIVKQGYGYLTLWKEYLGNIFCQATNLIWTHQDKVTDISII